MRPRASARCAPEAMSGSTRSRRPATTTRPKPRPRPRARPSPSPSRAPRRSSRNAPPSRRGALPPRPAPNASGARTASKGCRACVGEWFEVVRKRGFLARGAHDLSRRQVVATSQ
eukprot:6622593-Pyramimonas_sp.AAC.1